MLWEERRKEEAELVAGGTPALPGKWFWGVDSSDGPAYTTDRPVEFYRMVGIGKEFMARAPEAGSDVHRERHRTVLETAARLICEKGYEAASVQDIADACGLTKAGLYYYIRSKEELLLEIQSYGMDIFEERVLLPVLNIGDPVERLKACMEKNIFLVTEGWSKEVTIILHEHDTLTGAARAQINARKKRYVHFLESSFAEAVREGRMRPVEPRELVTEAPAVTVASCGDGRPPAARVMSAADRCERRLPGHSCCRSSWRGRRSHGARGRNLGIGRAPSRFIACRRAADPRLRQGLHVGARLLPLRRRRPRLPRLPLGRGLCEPWD